MGHGTRSYRSVAGTLGALLLLGAACGGEASPPATQETPGTLIMSIGGDEGTLTPFTYVTGDPGFGMLAMVYDNLLTLDRNNEVQPLLATGHEVSADGLTYTLPLTEGVTWHDGEPFTPEDVVFSFDYYRQHPSSIASGVRKIEDVGIDGNTVTLRLARPSPDLPVDLLARLPIIPEHLWAPVADPEAAGIELAVGTGPYRLVDYQPSQRYRFEANQDYALGSPKLDTVVLPVISEPATAFAALRSGEIDATSDSLEPQLVEQFRADEALALLEAPSFSLLLLQLNTQRAGLDQVAVRQAVSRAIDVDRLVDVVLLGTGVPGDPGFLPPESPLSALEAKHRFDPDEARNLLDRAGAVPGPDGIRALAGEPLAYTLLSYADDPSRIRTAELIRDMLAEVGITVTVQTQEMAAVDELVWPGFDVANGRNFDMAMWRWSAPVALSSGRFGSLLHSSPDRGTLNIGGFTQARADALVDELGSTIDEGRRAELVTELQRLIAEQVPFVPLLWPLERYAVRADAFDGWVVQKGAGILNRSSFVAGG